MNNLERKLGSEKLTEIRLRRINVDVEGMSCEHGKDKHDSYPRKDLQCLKLLL